MKKNDIKLILSLLIISAGLYVLIKQISPAGSFVIVRIDGTDVASYPLNEDVTVRLPDDNSTSYYNILEIKNSSANIKEADCKDKICVHHNPISKEGESIICLPHKLSIHIKEKDLLNE